ncbi:PTS transporter subunit EIIC [Collinsella sp. zg1085]|uniref:PTS transporter subunit EIIC n=1 Tax=Collinsella sp. zg1085 TaxID=2844380 RepID=UPI001C0B810D|nr:PTS transporter subunit EIIC [Collinsella sp. zg1085]QWT17211.1 PTS transporter subunit EIIC [Collinsella sp. zg1085]
MADNKQIAIDVLEKVGGADNVISATNCMTRLRLTLKDSAKADVEDIKTIKGVLGAQWSGSQLQVIIGQNVPKVLEEFIALSGASRGAVVEENLDAPKVKLTPAAIGNWILDYLSGSMTQLLPLVMAGGLFRTFAVVLGPQMLHVIEATDPTYTFFFTTLYEATFYFLPIYLGYAAAKKLGASPVLGMLCGGLLIAPSIVAAAAKDGSGIISVYGLSIHAANYSQSVLPIILTIPVLYVVEKFFKKHMPDVLSTVFTPFCTMIVTVPIALIVLAPVGQELGTLIANALFSLADLGGFGILIVMAILGGFWQLFVVAGMHMPVIILTQVQIVAMGYDPFVFVATNCAMTAVWGCAFGSFLRMRNKEEKSMALGYVISAIAGGVTEPALFGILLRFRKTMLGMFIGGAIGAVVSGVLGVTYYLAGGSSNFLVILNYIQGGQMNVIYAILGMAVSFVIAAIVVYFTGYSKEDLADMDRA